MGVTGPGAIGAVVKNSESDAQYIDRHDEIRLLGPGVKMYGSPVMGVPTERSASKQVCPSQNTFREQELKPVTQGYLKTIREETLLKL